MPVPQLKFAQKSLYGGDDRGQETRAPRSSNLGHHEWSGAERKWTRKLLYAHYLHSDLYPASASETWPISHVRARLDDGEEVHRVKNLGGWRDVIGCEMGSSPIRVYTTTKIFFSVENFKHGWKGDMVATMATLFMRELF